jgi:hypothetical protein
MSWTETSATHAFTNLLIGVSHAFHGSYRIGAAMPYAALMIWFARYRSGRAAIAGSLAFFAVLYAPFFVSRGFADRFDYAPSLAVALLLASAIVALSERSVATAVVAAIVLLAFYETGVRNRVRQWRESGEITRGGFPLRFLPGVRTRLRERFWLSKVCPQCTNMPTFS